ncbi:MAG: TolC family protein, partial [Zoogloeaceae bacterium]|nr:TolC family protein [Zoogloeaceae bacterium]
MKLNCMAVFVTGLMCLAQGEATALSFDEALSRAARAPEILSGLAGEEAALAAARAAGQLPDPRLLLSVDDFMLEGELRHRFNGSKRMIGLMQEIPASAKREAEREQAKAVLEASAREREYAQLAVRREVSLLWLKLYFLREKEALLKASGAEIRLRQKTATAALAGGEGAEMAMGALIDRQ